jgi:hypothetical protein
VKPGPEQSRDSVAGGLHRSEEDPWAEIFPEAVPEYPLSEELLAALAAWEGQPHNRLGSDKSWVSRLDEESRRHWRAAVLVR